MATIAPDTKCAFRLIGWNDGAYAYPTALGTPTPDTLTAYDQLALVSESVRQENRYVLDESLRANSSGYTSQDVIAKIFGGQIILEAAYTSLNQLIAACMGMEKIRTTDAGLEYPTFKECGQGSIFTGTAIVSAVTETRDPDPPETPVSAMIGDWIRQEDITAGTTRFAVRRITNVTYSAPNWIFSVSPNWTVANATGTSYSIARRFYHLYEFSKNLHAELATGIDSNAWHSDGWIVRAGVLGFDKGYSIWEFQAAMVNSLTFSISGGKMTVTAEVIPFGLDRSGFNTTSTAWAFSPATFARTERVLHGDGVFRIGTWDDGETLTDAERLGISSFTLTINNNLIGDVTSTSSSPYIIQPRRRALRSVTGSFIVPRQQSETRITSFENEGELMADYKFTGPTISGAAATTQLNFYLRKMQIQKADVPIEGQAALSQRYTFQCLQPAADSGGMPAHWDSLEQSELMIETYDSYPFNNFMGQHFTPA